MRLERSRQILQSIFQGVDPLTGAELPPIPLLQSPEVLRALLAGAEALAERAHRAERRASQPANMGKPWTQEEQDRLVAAFEKSTPLAELAVAHGRSLRAIESRLEVLGLLAPEERTTSNRSVRDGEVASKRALRGLAEE